MKRAVQVSLFADENFAGYRLKRFELLNWGTFDGKIWTLELDGRNGLLTGDNGSGKSTLVDAITTVFVQPKRIVYNKAAGADFKERDATSYVLGQYKSERMEGRDTVRPVYLRKKTSYSVLLAVMENEAMKRTLSLGVVFWFRESEDRVTRRYVAAERELSIERDFSGFGTDIAALFRKLVKVECFDSYFQYGAWFRRRLGLENDQAMDLFNQTISLKTVKNLTSFVRTHMLEPFDVQADIDHLVNNLDNLTRKHEAVIQAKEQIAALEPMVAKGEEHAEKRAELERVRQGLDTLPLFFTRLEIGLVEKGLALLDEELPLLKLKLAGIEEEVARLSDEERELDFAVREKGGSRVETVRKDRDLAQKELESCQNTLARYTALLGELGLKAEAGEEGFVRVQSELVRLRQGLDEREAALQNETSELGVARLKALEELALMEDEIRGLKARRSNIDERQVALRKRLCEALGIPEKDMPFAGELVRVNESERDWEGAVERLLRNFALSLLVPDRHYQKVAALVDREHLKGRLVYFRVLEKAAPAEEVPETSILNRIDLRPDTPYRDWLESEMSRRFNFTACEDEESFLRASRAITKAGQIKSPGGRHEKDDRYRVGDRRRFVLGWSNEEKIAALENDARVLKSRISGYDRELAERRAAREKVARDLRNLSRLDEYDDFSRINEAPLILKVRDLNAELKELEAADGELQVLKRQLEAKRAALQKQKTARDRLKIRIHDRESERTRLAQRLEAGAARMDAQPIEARTRLDVLEGSLMRLLRDQLGDETLELARLDSRERGMREALEERARGLEAAMNRLWKDICEGMVNFRAKWPVETRDMDADEESFPEFKKMLEQLQTENLPRFERTFKEELNKGTITDIAHFSGKLDSQEKIINERLKTVNDSLRLLDYNPDRYIALVARPNHDTEIREFRARLAECMEGSILGADGEDDHFSETRFLRVKKLIERFRGRQGSVREDAEWTRKVTDARNRLNFAASERWRNDDAEYEHYADTGGKSGGQKEKLAYTVLAASLACQYGLETGRMSPRSFRFVIIDEAFGKGSNDSTRFALHLFEKLKLQLLIVTPGQKSEVIEPFVSHVAVVENRTGSSSSLVNMSIETYRKVKSDYLAAHAPRDLEAIDVNDLEIVEGTVDGTVDGTADETGGMDASDAGNGAGDAVARP